MTTEQQKLIEELAKKFPPTDSTSVTSSGVGGTYYGGFPLQYRYPGYYAQPSSCPHCGKCRHCGR